MGLGCGFTYTDDRGYFGGLVPQGIILTIEVSLEDCGIVYTAEIGPFEQDTNLGNIVINTEELTSAIVSGILYDCDGNPVSDPSAYATINLSSGNSYIAYAGADGSFSQSITTCNDTAGLEILVNGVNPAEGLYADPASLPFSTNINAGNIFLCNELDSYFTIMEGLITDDSVSIFTPCFAQISGDTIYITSSYQENPSVIFNFKIVATAPGTYTAFELENENATILEAIGFNVIVTNYNSEPGTTISGTFNDNVNNEPPAELIGGVFKALVL